MTNMMLIKSMNDEQLAYFLTNTVPYDLMFCHNNCEEVRKWLNKENDHIYHYRKVII